MRRYGRLVWIAQRNVDRTNPQTISGPCGPSWCTEKAARGLQPGLAVDMLYKNTAPNSTMKPAAPSPVLRATRLLDQVRERIRYKHYSLRTEQAYVQWVRIFVKWHGLRHPRDMGQEEIEGFLAMLANERRVGG